MVGNPRKDIVRRVPEYVKRGTIKKMKINCEIYLTRVYNVINCGQDERGKHKQKYAKC